MNANTLPREKAVEMIFKTLDIEFARITQEEMAAKGQTQRS